MGRDGHFTFAWDAENDSEVEAQIRRKMDQGVVFRILRRGPFSGAQHQVIRSVEEITDDRKVVIADADVAAFFAAGVARHASTDPFDEDDITEAPPATRARTPREVRQNETIAHRPLAGG
jgi:hypothetical protein